MKCCYVILLVLLLGFAGCEIYEPYETPLNYYLTPDKDISSLGRIALVELGNETGFHEISLDMSTALFQELQKKQMFGVKFVAENDPEWRSMQLRQDASYTFEQLLEMRNTLKCDGVLIGSVTSYKPYPHMSIALQLRMVDLTDGQLLWAMEQVWDTTDKTTGHRMRKYYGDLVVGTKKLSVIGPETPSAQLGFVSSLKFIKFVAYETAGTFVPEVNNSILD